MGGQNHQPCSHFLANSTRLSRSISKAHASLQMANVVLEDILLLEMEGEGRSPAELVGELVDSSTWLDDASRHLDALNQQMLDEQYQDLPTIRTVNLSSVGEELAANGQVDLAAWQTVQGVMYAESFYAVLDRHRESIKKLVMLTEELKQVCAALRVGAFTETMEYNGEGNLKPAFAKLYSTWNRFNQEFLASSLITTELWYAHVRCGSLASGAHSVRFRVV